jgi:hypothetical protein
MNGIEGKRAGAKKADMAVISEPKLSLVRGQKLR